MYLKWMYLNSTAVFTVPNQEYLAPVAHDRVMACEYWHIAERVMWI